jgi:hypothetical protein|tara:strand:- start:322 stop:807 length:486 start_codon:yes stop_codon:yes gene_type:complete
MDTLFNIIDTLTSQPWYVYVCTFIIFAVIFGRAKEWEFEAKLFKADSRAVTAELEIKKFKKKPPQGQLTLQGLQAYYNQDIEIIVSKQTIQKLRINAEGTHYNILYPRIDGKSGEIYRHKNERKYNKLNIFLDPHITIENKQDVVIRANNQDILSGAFIED